MNTSVKMVKCKKCKQEGHLRSNKKFHPDYTPPQKKASKKESKTPPPPKEMADTPSSNPDLELLRQTLLESGVQKGLIALYSESKAECKRDGKCGMEIGMAREKDQGAVLKLFLADKINLDINNDLPEDYIIGSSKISAKHSGSKVGTPVKVKWTAATTTAKETVESMINAPDSYYPHLLLTYIEEKEAKITIVCVSADHNRTIIKTLKEGAFKIRDGNSRGIEYSKEAMNQFSAKKEFEVVIHNVNMSDCMGPIERRIKLLKKIGINPEDFRKRMGLVLDESENAQDLPSDNVS